MNKVGEEEMKQEASFFEQLKAFKKREAALGDDRIGVIVPPGLTDEEFAEYIALFNAGHRRKVNCRDALREGGEGALWNFIRSVAGRNNIPAEEVERDIEKAIKAVREGYGSLAL